MKKTILAIIIVSYILVPTGTPDDFLTFFIIKQLGAELYFLLLGAMLLLMWHYKIHFGTVHKAMKIVFKEIKKFIGIK